MSIFDETTNTGKELKRLLIGVFQPMVDNATSALPRVREIAIRTIIQILKSFSSFMRRGGFEMLFTNGKERAEELYGTVKNIVKALDAIATTINFVSDYAPWNVADTAKKHIAEQDEKKFEVAFGSASAEEATSVGLALTAGITKGIQLGTPEAAKAMTGLADAALAAFKERNQIRSPSALYRDTARWIPRGEALGVEDETPKVETAIEKMGSPDAMGAGGSVEMKGSRGGDVYNFNISVQANTRADAEAIGEVVEQKVVEMFSRRRAAKGV